MRILPVHTVNGNNTPLRPMIGEIRPSEHPPCSTFEFYADELSDECNSVVVLPTSGGHNTITNIEVFRHPSKSTQHLIHYRESILLPCMTYSLLCLSCWVRCLLVNHQICVSMECHGWADKWTVRGGEVC